MDRRRFLALAYVTVGTASAGCSVVPGSHADRPDTGADSPTQVVVWNRTGEAIDVRVTIERRDKTLVDESFAVAADDERAVDSGITRTCGYKIDVSVDDGPSESFATTVDDHDLNMGSDQILDVRDDGIQLVVQE